MKAKEISALVRKDLLQEWKQRYTISGILLYLTAAVFVSYLAFRALDKPAWNALFWIIMLFSGVSAVAKSFIQESKGRSLYLHQLADPRSVIIAKLIYNTILMMALSLTGWAIYTLLMGNMADNPLYYLFTLLMGCGGFAAVLTMTSAIASKAGNSHLLMPVLSIPLLVPLLLVAVQAGKKAVDGLDTSLLLKDFLVLGLFYVLIGILAYILFPLVWKE